MPLSAAGGDRRQQVGDGRAGAEPDRHPVLDQLRRRLGGDALLGVGRSRRALYPGIADSLCHYGDICDRVGSMLAAMDARIWLTGEGGEPRSVALAGERTVVGRDPEADIQHR